jgi:hypothetical protein
MRFHILVEIKLLKFLFTQLKLQIGIRKIKKIRNIKDIKYIKTVYAASYYWPAPFRCDRDGRTASAGVLLVFDLLFLLLCEVYLRCFDQGARSNRFCAGLDISWLLSCVVF